jgi:hypothetical protein
MGFPFIRCKKHEVVVVVGSNVGKKTTICSLADSENLNQLKVSCVGGFRLHGMSSKLDFSVLNQCSGTLTTRIIRDGVW